MGYHLKDIDGDRHPEPHTPGRRLSGLGQRYYSPFTGRWISRDPANEEDDDNLYSYCANSALVYVDPHGEWKIKWPKWDPKNKKPGKGTWAYCITKVFGGKLWDALGKAADNAKVCLLLKADCTLGSASEYLDVKKLTATDSWGKSMWELAKCLQPVPLQDSVKGVPVVQGPPVKQCDNEAKTLTWKITVSIEFENAKATDQEKKYTASKTMEGQCKKDGPTYKACCCN